MPSPHSDYCAHTSDENVKEFERVEALRERAMIIVDTEREMESHHGDARRFALASEFHALLELLGR